MKVLAIRQPWAWAIVHAGKDIENRDWSTFNPQLRFRGEFLILAAAGMSGPEYADFVDFYRGLAKATRGIAPDKLDVPEKDELQRGGIVGRARVVDVVTSHASPWFQGPYGFVLADARPTPFVPMKGQLGFFDAPADVLSRLAA